MTIVPYYVIPKLEVSQVAAFLNLGCSGWGFIKFQMLSLKLNHDDKIANEIDFLRIGTELRIKCPKPIFSCMTLSIGLIY